MNDSPFISIILPVYNVEDYLRECLDSIFNQPGINYPIEIIAVNDGSTDGSLAILQEYEVKHENMRVIDQKNSGAGGARNTGINAAQGKYLMFVDSDDFLTEDSLGKLLDYAGKSGADIIQFEYLRYKNGVTYKKNKKYASRQDNGRDIFVTWRSSGTLENAIWARIYSRRMIKKYDLRFLPEIFGEDAEFSLRVFYFAETVEYLPLAVYVYRMNRPGSAITSGNFFKRNMDSIKIIDSLYEFQKNINDERYRKVLLQGLGSQLARRLKGLRGEQRDIMFDKVLERFDIFKYSRSPVKRFFFIMGEFFSRRAACATYFKLKNIPWAIEDFLRGIRKK